MGTADREAVRVLLGETDREQLRELVKALADDGPRLGRKAGQPPTQEPVPFDRVAAVKPPAQADLEGQGQVSPARLEEVSRVGDKRLGVEDRTEFQQAAQFVVQVRVLGVDFAKPAHLRQQRHALVGVRVAGQQAVLQAVEVQPHAGSRDMGIRAPRREPAQVGPALAWGEVAIGREEVEERRRVGRSAGRHGALRIDQAALERALAFRIRQSSDIDHAAEIQSGNFRGFSGGDPKRITLSRGRGHGGGDDRVARAFGGAGDAAGHRRQLSRILLQSIHR